MSGSAEVRVRFCGGSCQVVRRFVSGVITAYIARLPSLKIRCLISKVTVLEWNGRKQYIPNLLEYGDLIFIRFGSFSCLIKVSETNG